MSSKAKQTQKLLLFRLSGERLFGIGTLKIREILPFMRLTKLPHSHHAVIGTATFRGSAVPVIDMAAAVGYPPLTQDGKKPRLLSRISSARRSVFWCAACNRSSRLTGNR
jgi:two-component system chemotaxis response regulator CheV